MRRFEGLRQRRLVAVAATAVLGTGLLAGCGGSNSVSTSPSSKLLADFHNLQSGSSLTTTLKLGGGAQALTQLSGAGGHIPPKTAKALSEISLRVVEHAPSGTLRSETQAHKVPDTEFQVLVANHPYADIRYVGGALYLQADVHGLLTKFGAPKDVFGNLQAEVSQGPKFIGALLSGKWVSLPQSTLSSLQDELKSVLQQQPGSSSTTATGQKLLKDVRSIYQKDVKVKQTASSGATRTYTLSGNESTIGRAFINDIASLEPALRQQLSKQPTPNIPNKTISAQVTVTGDDVSQISLDVAQFIPNNTSHVSFPIVLQLSTAATTVAAPSGATPVDLSQLGPILSQLGAGIPGA